MEQLPPEARQQLVTKLGELPPQQRMLFLEEVLGQFAQVQGGGGGGAPTRCRDAAGRAAAGHGHADAAPSRGDKPIGCDEQPGRDSPCSDDQGAVEAVASRRNWSRRGRTGRTGGSPEPRIPGPRLLRLTPCASSRRTARRSRFRFPRLSSGYQRQADYTRKTQELAEQQTRRPVRADVATGVGEQPGRDAADSPVPVRPKPEPEPEQTWDDPVEARYHELGQRIGAVRGSTSPMGTAVKRSGCSSSVTARSSTHTMWSPERSYRVAWTSKSVYKEMAFDRYWAGQTAARDQQAADEQARIDAKTQAGNVHSGSGANNAVTRDDRSVPTLEERVLRGETHARASRNAAVHNPAGGGHHGGNPKFDSCCRNDRRQLPQDPHRQHLQVTGAAVVADREEQRPQAFRRREDRRTADLSQRARQAPTASGMRSRSFPRKASRQPSTRGGNCSPRSPSPVSKRPRTTVKRQSSTCSSQGHAGRRDVKAKLNRMCTATAPATRGRTSSGWGADRSGRHRCRWHRRRTAGNEYWRSSTATGRRAPPRSSVRRSPPTTLPPTATT